LDLFVCLARYSCSRKRKTYACGSTWVDSWLVCAQALGVTSGATELGTLGVNAGSL